MTSRFTGLIPTSRPNGVISTISLHLGGQLLSLQSDHPYSSKGPPSHLVPVLDMIVINIYLFS